MTKAEVMLIPKRFACLACNATYAHLWELPLCRACADSIPWILQVKCVWCGRPEICPDCLRRKDTYFVRNRSAVSYSPQMKAWLGTYKYRGREGMRHLIGTMLLHAYHLHKQCEVGHVPGTDNRAEYITYVPLSDKRLSERGFNQSKQLAEELGRKTGIPVISVLQRLRHTDKQSFKTRGDRLEDLQNVFAVHPSAKNNYQSLFDSTPVTLYVVDDVYTTGSTLNECAKAVKKELKADICGISWAR